MKTYRSQFLNTTHTRLAQLVGEVPVLVGGSVVTEQRSHLRIVEALTPALVATSIKFVVKAVLLCLGNLFVGVLHAFSGGSHGDDILDGKWVACCWDELIACNCFVDEGRMYGKFIVSVLCANGIFRGTAKTLGTSAFTQFHSFI